MSSNNTVAIQTTEALNVPPSLNAQGSVLDPVQIKKSSAAKMRLADKTGNIALRKEAAAEQSFADRLGGRTALLSDELKLQIQQQKLQAETAAASSTEPVAATETKEEAKEETKEEAKVEQLSQEAPQQEQTKRRNRKQRNKPAQPEAEQQETPVPRQHAPLKPTSQPFEPKGLKTQAPQVQAQPQPQPQAQTQAQMQAQMQAQALLPFNSAFAGSTLPPEAIILKLDAASKQSIADKTGNLVLKRTAALEQSLADKMAFVSSPGITTTALRAGRKGFVLDPLFQTQAAPAAAAVVSAPVVAPAQQPKKQKQPKQAQPTQQPAKQMQHSVSLMQVPQQQKQVKIMQHSASLAHVPQQAQAQSQPQQPQQKQVKRTMQHSSSLTHVPQQQQQQQPAKPKSMQYSRSMGAIQPTKPTRSDALDWRVPQQTATQPPKISPRPVSPKPATTSEVLPQRSSSNSKRNSGGQYRLKNNKADEPEIDDITKIKQQIADVIAPLTPATASM